MRTMAILAACLISAGLAAQDPLSKRYTYDADEKAYSQKSPEDAMKSVIRAIGSKKFDYLMAQIVDPVFVDTKVANYKKLYDKGKEEGKALLAFLRLVKETEEHFLEDPALIADLKRFAKEAEWKVDENAAIGTVKTIGGRNVFLKKIGERWFLENRQRKE